MQNFKGDIQLNEQKLIKKNLEINNYDTNKVYPVMESIEGTIEK